MNKTFTSNDNNVNGFVYDNGPRNIGNTFASSVKVFCINLIVLAVAITVAYVIISHLG